MEIKEESKGIEIKITKDYVEKSYKEGRYLEAILLTHIVLEVHMKHIFTLFNYIRDPTNLAQFERLKAKRKGKSKYPIFPAIPYNFITIANILLDLGIFDANLFSRLEKFNKHRNTVVHRLFDKLPSKRQLDSYFKLGMELWEETWKIEEKYIKANYESMKKFMKNLEKRR